MKRKTFDNITVVMIALNNLEQFLFNSTPKDGDDVSIP